MKIDMETNPKYQEILKLDELLDKIEIPHVIRKSYAGWCIECKRGKRTVGVAIQHDKTLGHEDDLIEVRGFDLAPDEKDGFLTVEDAFAYFAWADGLKHLQTRKKPAIK